MYGNYSKAISHRLARCLLIWFIPFLRYSKQRAKNMPWLLDRVALANRHQKKHSCTPM